VRIACPAHEKRVLAAPPPPYANSKSPSSSDSSRKKHTAAPQTQMMQSQMMMQPSPQIVRRYGIPKDVLRAAYRDNPLHRQRTIEAVAKVRQLCQELDIVTPGTVKLWKAFHLWPKGAAAA